ncbi:hypothetical protein [Sphingobium sp. YR768]|uniref:hypothetical protein n=1 Tax=Sphingobium sp. YR768 TaxID=1884365 RepID=UPI0008C8F527|nr:hypothetical protein [Sphingobium sp. YR768]SER80792.1 hypothetical protein SAMN05518866_11974 [Sphingobium sp. YR768]
MTSIMPRTPKRLDPIEGIAPFDEQLLAMVTALTSEIAMVRARLDTCERLLVNNGVIGAAAIEAYVPDASAQQQREQDRNRLLRKVFRPLHEAAAAELSAGQGVV